MTSVILTPRAGGTAALDASGLDLGRFVELDEAGIARLQLRAGNDLVALGDVFAVRGGQSTHVEIDGTVTHVYGLGTRLGDGSLTIRGDAGDGVGGGMNAGRIQIDGSVGHDAGTGMRGGVLEVRGNAGDRLGGAGPGARRGMTGGEIIVRGAAGREAGMRARRGLIVVARNTGAELGRDMIAGTVVALGRVGADPGRGSRRGSIIAIGGIQVRPTYRLACTYQPPFVRLLMTYLNHRFGLNVSEDVVSGRFRRYCGDAGIPGKGEILEWIPT